MSKKVKLSIINSDIDNLISDIKILNFTDEELQTINDQLNSIKLYIYYKATDENPDTHEKNVYEEFMFIFNDLQNKIKMAKMANLKN
jgi:hypothetical protein